MHSTALPGRRAERVRVLEVDRALAAAIPATAREQAVRDVVAPLLVLQPGEYQPAAFDRYETSLGLLVLDGLMIRRVALADRTCGELVGRGALLRPWDHLGEHAPLPFDVSWSVLEPTRVVLLADSVLLAAARWPALTRALIERALERAQTLAFTVAIHSLQHVSLRLLCLFWHFADRFGAVTPHGTKVPLRLTHHDLAELTGAQRPTVSKALAELERSGLLKRAGEQGWLLLGEPPEELRDLRAHRGEHYEAGAA